MTPAERAVIDAAVAWRRSWHQVEPESWDIAGRALYRALDALKAQPPAPAPADAVDIVAVPGRNGTEYRSVR